MTRANYNASVPAAARFPVTESVRDVLRDCEQQGLLDELQQALGIVPRPDEAAVRAVRDLVYELAGARNRDLAVDVLIYATGVAEFDVTSLRGYAARHGLTPEGFRKQVLAMQRRLGLPPRPMQHSDAN
jgi:tagatose-1,6-bisphosphate aldolase non-catalytic subunit AgaZ/GatZ